MDDVGKSIVAVEPIIRNKWTIVISSYIASCVCMHTITECKGGHKRP